MHELALTPPIGPNVRRGPGRPKGARSKRSLELGRYIEAMYGGMTPGQQSAAVCLVTPRQLKLAGGDLTAALVAKAHDLAAQLHCTSAEAWVLMAKERMELMAYVHQKQPQAAPPPPKGEEGAVYIVPDGVDRPLLEFVDDLDPDELQVVQEKSHGDA